MRCERPRAARYHFIASATLTDLESSRQTQENICDLSLFGCLVVPGNSAPTGTRIRVRIQIIHNGESFEALGRVMNVRSITGVGISFSKIEERYQFVLDRWIAALRNKKTVKPIA